MRMLAIDPALGFSGSLQTSRSRTLVHIVLVFPCTATTH